MKKTIRVFISYASEDRDYKDKLLDHLAPLKEKRLIEAWDDEQLIAGSNWTEKIKNEIEAAQIILLMISSYVLSSEDKCYQEIEQALKRQESGEVVVIPIIVRPCFWILGKFARLQVLPTEAKPISTWDNEDEAYVSVVEEIVKVIRTYTSDEFLSNVEVKNEAGSNIEDSSPSVIDSTEQPDIPGPSPPVSKWHNCLFTILLTGIILFILCDQLSPCKRCLDAKVEQVEINIDYYEYGVAVYEIAEYCCGQVLNVTLRCDTCTITYGFPLSNKHKNFEVFKNWEKKLSHKEEMGGNKQFKIKYVICDKNKRFGLVRELELVDL